ncbi:hypothetical protein ACE6H2_005225 [Prunus campanulata]
MAGCMSTPSKTIKSRKKHCQRVIKRHRKATCSASDGMKKRNTSFKKINCDAEARMSDYAVSEFVHVDFENGATTSHKRSKVSSSTFHVTHLQWHHSQYDSNVIFQEEAWFDSVSILDSDSDDDFISIHGVFQLGISQVAKYFSTKDLLTLLIYNGCKHGEYQSYMKIDGGKSDKITAMMSAGNQIGQSKRFLYRPRPGYIIPCCRVEKLTSVSWSEIPPSSLKFRGENYFKYDFGFFFCQNQP